MTVVLLDPLRPTMVPAEAVEFLSGVVEFTEEVPVRTRWLFSGVAHADGSADVLVSTDRRNPHVVQRISHGDRLIDSPKLPGDDLVAAVVLMDRLRVRGGGKHSRLTHHSAVTCSRRPTSCSTPSTVATSSTSKKSWATSFCRYCSIRESRRTHRRMASTSTMLQPDWSRS